MTSLKWIDTLGCYPTLHRDGDTDERLMWLVRARLTDRGVRKILREMNDDYDCGSEGLIERVEVIRYKIGRSLPGRTLTRYRLNLVDGTSINRTADWHAYKETTKMEDNDLNQGYPKAIGVQLCYDMFCDEEDSGDRRLVDLSWHQWCQKNPRGLDDVAEARLDNRLVRLIDELIDLGHSVGINVSEELGRLYSERNGGAK